jgi:hypothetical protein
VKPAPAAPAAPVAPVPAAPAPAAAVTSCDAAKIALTGMPAGRVQINIESTCRRGQTVTLQYGGYDLVRKLDDGGKAAIALDLFAGKSASATITFADGRAEAVAMPLDREALSKVALIWQAPVDLDLHAIEGGGSFGKQGHVWANGTVSFDKAKAVMTETGRGVGFLSTSDTGQHEGTKIEVYTFLHSPEQGTGAVNLLIDYVTRGAQPAGEMCSTGRLAEIPFDVVILDQKGRIQRESGVVPAAPCGETLSANARYLRGAISDLRYKN